jgi:hypothetical protein
MQLSERDVGAVGRPADLSQVRDGDRLGIEVEQVRDLGGQTDGVRCHGRKYLSFPVTAWAIAQVGAPLSFTPLADRPTITQL